MFLNLVTLSSLPADVYDVGFAESGIAVGNLYGQDKSSSSCPLALLGRDEAQVQDTERQKKTRTDAGRLLRSES